MNQPTVLILCTGNSCRSHMAEGILRNAAGDLFEVHSAGSKPAGHVHPMAIEVLEEIGIELCNLKLGIRPRVPFVFFDAKYFNNLRKQLTQMIAAGRAPAWMQDYMLFTDDPDEVVAFYREKLQVL